MNKFTIIHYRIGEDGVYFKIRPDVKTFESIEAFMKELFPGFSFEKCGFPKSNDFKDYEGKKFLDDSGNALYQINMVEKPSYSKDYFGAGTPESLKEQARKNIELGAHVRIDYWSDVEKMKKFLPEYCANPNVAFKAVKKIIPKSKTISLTDPDMDKLFGLLTKFFRQNNISDVELFHFNSSIDDSVYEKISIEKLQEKTIPLLDEYSDVSFESRHPQIIVSFEGKGFVDITFPEDLDMSFLQRN